MSGLDREGVLVFAYELEGNPRTRVIFIRLAITQIDDCQLGEACDSLHKTKIYRIRTNDVGIYRGCL